MRHAHFLVLTGRLNEFPLHELIETLRGQRKTGRLLIEFAAGPCALYFREGALVDASLGTLRGLEALSLALSLQQEEAAPFNFNPLVAPPDAPDAKGATTNASDSTAIFAREAATYARAQVIEVEAAARAQETAGSAAAGALPVALDDSARPRALLPAAEEGALVERLARIETVVSAQARRANIERAVYAVVIIILIAVAFLWRGRDATDANVLRAAAETASETLAAPPHATLPAMPPAMNATVPETTSSVAQPSNEARAEPQSSAPSNSASVVSPVADATRPAPKPDARTNEARARQLSSNDAATPARAAQTQTTRPAPQSVQSKGDAAARGDANRTGRSAGHVVQVRMTIERGRVLRAEVSNPRPGMAAYEALALRMARQRRYPEEFSGQETLRLSVGQ